jgi:dTDP-3-amino-2,3,6-trideoxy-4-keto-D-glucose/dTDP-3-amino-3,4,6-trideoxy-alpha-D-glucose/dTDP-2,6-dideoxy-D-kanosamine transaminase
VGEFLQKSGAVRVNYSYLREQFADCGAILHDIKGLIETSQFTLGAAVRQFEESFARLCASRHAVGVGSGTDALFLALKAIGVGPGDEVISPPNSFIATTGAIVAAGARPVYVDVGEDFNINPALIERAIGPRTKALLPVHYAGCPAQMDRILPIAAAHRLPVVEDACQAISGALDGRVTGSFGIAAGFSLHPLKNLNVWGDGGVVVTSDPDVHARLRLLRNHGLRNRDEVEIFGYNSRLDTLQAIVANHLIKDAEAITNARIRNAARLDLGLRDLAGDVTLPPRRPEVRQVYHNYMLQARDRDRLLVYLHAKGVEAKIHYPIPLHLQPAARHLGYKVGDFPVCERQAKAILTLPIHQHLTDDQLGYMLETIRSFYRR